MSCCGKPAVCPGRRKYPSEQAAELAAQIASKTTRRHFEAYYCPHCQGFHIGHRPASAAGDTNRKGGKKA
jgi:hypothetical protein